MATWPSEDRPVLVDLFCGGGGASLGYWLAGFDVLGVDTMPQDRLRYPFPFVQMDALEFLATADLSGIAGVHASPPCQFWSSASGSWNGHPAKADYPDLIDPTREALLKTGLPYIMENVPEAPLRDPIMLCGAMFPGLRVYRHRMFESNFPLSAPAHPEHVVRTAKLGRRARSDEFMTVAGHYSGADFAKKAMGIHWMTRRELAEAIPPAYSFHLGSQLFAFRTGTCYNVGMFRSRPVPAPLLNGRPASLLEGQMDVWECLGLADPNEAPLEQKEAIEMAANKEIVNWRELPKSKKLAFLLSHPTIADSAHTDEKREEGEDRATFLKRIYGRSKRS